MITLETKGGALKRAATLKRNGRGNLDDLRANVKKFGILQPIVVRKSTQEVIVGERRRSVAKALGLKVPVVEVDVTQLEAAELRVSEELSHEPHDVMAVAKEVRRIYEKRGGGVEGNTATFTKAMLAKVLGVTPGKIDYLLSLASIQPSVQRLVGENLTPAKAQHIDTIGTLSSRDKELLAKKVADGKIEAPIKHVVEAIRKDPERAKRWIRNEETTWTEVERAEERREKKSAKGPTDTVSSLAATWRETLRRWGNTLRHKGTKALVPFFTDRDWESLTSLLVALEEAAKDLRQSRPGTRAGEKAAAEAKEALLAKPGRVRELVVDAQGVWREVS